MTRLMKGRALAAALAALAPACGGPGPVSIALPPPEPICGDGIVGEAESCDDGNLDDRDDCLSTCTLASCADGVRGAGETAPDCGGSRCTPCGVGLGCAGPLDCASGLCERGVCVETLCDVAAYEGRAYLFCGWEETHDAARAACAAFGYQLFSANDGCENAFAIETFTTRYPRYRWWLGLTDTAEEGVWVWEDGSPADYGDWWFGEPNDADGEDCAEYRPDGFWNDNDCATRNRFICEDGAPTAS